MFPKHGRKECWDNSGYKIFTNTNEVWGERIDLPGTACMYYISITSVMVALIAQVFTIKYNEC